MKILHLIPSMNMGGAEKFALDLANELAVDDSNEVYLCSIDKISDDSILSKQVSPKVHLISLDKTTGYSLAIIFKVFNLIRKLKPDIVHTHLRALPYASFSLVLLRIPTVHTIHNLAHKETKPVVQKVHKVLFDLFNIVPVSISDLVLESTKVRYGNKYNELIYNGVKALSKTKEYDNVKREIDKYKRTDNTLVFLSVGRISKQKNQLMHVEAMKRLNDSGMDFISIVIGALDSDVEYAKVCLEAAKNSSNMHFIGLKSNIGDYMYCSDALCLSSIYEGLPLVVLEAMSMGKPVLSTPAGGVPDVVQNGINGYISKDFEEESYVDILNKYSQYPIENFENIKKLYDENYSMQICMNNYYDLYKKRLAKI